MKVSIVGTGYVGLVSGVCFAELGHNVTCVDIDQKKIDLLLSGSSPIYEAGLEELIKKNSEAGRLNFTTNFNQTKDSEVAFIAVGTPSLANGDADLSFVFSAVEKIIEFIPSSCPIVLKSTVPIGTSKVVTSFIKEKSQKEFPIINNPEFLKEGSAVHDFMKAERVIVGLQDQASKEIMQELYRPLARKGVPLIFMSNNSAELTKYAANAFLATRISFINEMAKLCDSFDADIAEVRAGMSSDKRIGKYFLYPGPGYGGSCFPKDVSAIINIARSKGLELKMAKATQEVNELQKKYIFEKIKAYFNNQLEGKEFCLWGVSFKAGTDDIRKSPAIEVAKLLTNEGAKCRFYDPVAADNFEKLMNELKLDVKKSNDKYEAINNSNGLIIMTEWQEFSSPDFSLIKNALKTPVIFDARNILDHKKAQSHSLDYFGIGKRV
jgi:UDPglucose 6-dehydrogenase